LLVIKLLEEQEVMKMTLFANRSFWQEVRKIRASKLSSNCVIDGFSYVNEMAQLFGDKCRQLYSSKSHGQTEMKRINDRTDYQLIMDSFSSDRH
jgi:hypothetical protein